MRILITDHNGVVLRPETFDHRALTQEFVETPALTSSSNGRCSLTVGGVPECRGHRVASQEGRERFHKRTIPALLSANVAGKFLACTCYHIVREVTEVQTALMGNHLLIPVPAQEELVLERGVLGLRGM